MSNEQQVKGSLTRMYNLGITHSIEIIDKGWPDKELIISMLNKHIRGSSIEPQNPEAPPIFTTPWETSTGLEEPPTLFLHEQLNW